MEPALSMLVHGMSKVGKSLLAASTPAPRVYFDVESAARFLPIRGIQWDPRDPPPSWSKTSDWDTAVVSVREWQDAQRTFDWLHGGKHPFRSASVDSISELQYRYIEDVAGRNQVKLQDWGSVLRIVGGFMRDLRDLTFHANHPLEAVVVTAMTKETGDGMLRPHLQGQLNTVVPYLMDVTAYLFVEADNKTGQEVRKLRTRRLPGRIEAGERVGGRIPAIVTLPQVTGSSTAEIAARNTTFSKLIKLVFKDGGPLMAEPAVVSTIGDASASTGEGKEEDV